MPASGPASASIRKYVGFGVDFFDFDNDGWKDIFIANGHVYAQIASRKLHLTYRQPKVLYRNLGNGQIRGCVRNSGRRDSRGEPRSRLCLRGFRQRRRCRRDRQQPGWPSHAAAQRWREQRATWILIKCMGTRSNRSGIGTRVKVTSGARSQIDEVRSGSSYYSQMISGSTSDWAMPPQRTASSCLAFRREGDFPGPAGRSSLRHPGDEGNRQQAAIRSLGAAKLPVFSFQ